uniref:Uncharacterized protein n=1 Tax=viral metagenome TaxID=1070528 RepID=A0A6C0E2D8_9ZZZZ
MAYVSNYTFDNMSRIGNDGCCIDQNTIQNAQSCNYLLQNYFSADCSMKNAKLLATTQPCINYSGGYGLAVGGCNVQESSKLLLGGIQTHPRCRIDLYQRPFATVPFLGRGSVDPILESQIQQGESITNKRTVTKLTEQSYLKYHTTPLLLEVKENIQNPANLVEGVASEGWVRGGVPSRELTKDMNYYTTHTAGQYV